MKITKRSDIPPMNLFLFPYKTEEDKEFVAKVKTFLNSGRYSWKARGRGARTKPSLEDIGRPRGYDQDLPLDRSERVAIYIEERESLQVAIQEFLEEEKLKRWKELARAKLEETIKAYEEEYGETYNRSE
mgnify:FL=1|tara:strand:- start:78 stop:467 length:390 start_codon:yes stop_codon:yes gene_type:complete